MSETTKEKKGIIEDWFEITSVHGDKVVVDNLGVKTTVQIVGKASREMIGGNALIKYCGLLEGKLIFPKFVRYE